MRDPLFPDLDDLELEQELGDPELEAKTDGVAMLEKHGHPTLAPHEPPDPSLPEDKAWKQELDTLGQRLREQSKASREWLKLVNDTDYYFTVVFLSQAQRDAFLKATGWDKYGQFHLDGLALAKALGIELPQVELTPIKERPPGWVFKHEMDVLEDDELDEFFDDELE